MNEHPILFSTPMVQANLENRKTNTRRLNNLDEINGMPDLWKFEKLAKNLSGKLVVIFKHKFDGFFQEIPCPYGQPGDLLWVRECFTEWPKGEFQYKASTVPGDELGIWKPSIHMPKAAARIWLQVAEIRVERLQDISEEDAKAEGVEPLINTFPGIDNFKDIKTTNYRTGFMKIWIKINGEESWKYNPWIWVVKYKILSTTGKPVIQNS